LGFRRSLCCECICFFLFQKYFVKYGMSMIRIRQSSAGEVGRYLILAFFATYIGHILGIVLFTEGIPQFRVESVFYSVSMAFCTIQTIAALCFGALTALCFCLRKTLSMELWFVVFICFALVPYLTRCAFCVGS
jgi:hypothetical protein